MRNRDSEIRAMKRNSKRRTFTRDSDSDDEEEDGQLLTEREREEALFRRAEENESAKTRMMIEKNLRGDSPVSEEEPVPPKRLRVAEIFASDSDDSADPEVTELQQLEAVRVTRNQLKEWAFMPFFSRKVPGFFVRVNVGVKNSEPAYRIAQIIGIEEEGGVYQLEDIKVRKRLRLSVLGFEKVFRISFVSNQPFSDSEWTTLLETARKKGGQLPRMSEIAEKTADLAWLRAYRVTGADIDAMVRERSTVEATPKNYAFLRKKLANDLELAEMEGNTEEVSRLSAELAEINREYDKITAANAARLKNETVSQEQWVQELEKRERLFEAEVLADRDQGDDPFTRRKTAPRMVQFLSSSTLKSESRARLLEQRQNKGVPVQKPASNTSAADEKPIAPPVVDLCKLHDFELDISIDI